MDCKTQKGLYFLMIGLVITLTYGFITSVVNAIIQDTTVTLIIGFFGLIAFIGLILLLAGLYYFYIGRKEFGEKHENSVKKALTIFLINIIMSVIFASIISFFVFTAISGNSPTDLFAPVFMIMAIISAILGGLMYYFGLIELENEKGKNVLYLGIISSIVLSIITSFYLAGMLGDLFGSIPSMSSYSSLSITQNTGIIGIFGIIPNLLYLCAFYIPYERIKEGELVPQVTTSGGSTLPSRICPNCGRPIPEDAGICPYCGKKFW